MILYLPCESCKFYTPDYSIHPLHNMVYTKDGRYLCDDCANSEEVSCVPVTNVKLETRYVDELTKLGIEPDKSKVFVENIVFEIAQKIQDVSNKFIEKGAKSSSVDVKISNELSKVASEILELHLYR